MSRALRWLLGGIVCVGVGGFALGLVGDLRQWWDHLGFTSNVLAGMTGACFGIPFGVVVLQKVLDDNEKMLTSKIARNRVKRGFEELAQAIGLTESVGGPQLLPWTLTSKRVAELFGRGLATTLGFPGPTFWTWRNPSHQRKVVSEIREALDEVRRIENVYRAQRSWYEVRNKWEALSEELVPAGEEAGLRLNSAYLQIIDGFLADESSRELPQLLSGIRDALEQVESILCQVSTSEKDLFAYMQASRILHTAWTASKVDPGDWARFEEALSRVIIEVKQVDGNWRGPLRQNERR